MTTVRRPRQAHAWLVAVLLVLGPVSVLLAAGDPGTSVGQAAGDLVPEPILGPAGVDEMHLMAAVPEGVPGEVWGWRELPARVPPASAAGAEFGPPSQEQQLAFYRYTDATGWQLIQTPLDRDAQPFRGFRPYTGTTPPARLTRRGGGAVIGRAPDGRAGVLHREPGGRFRLLPDPPGEVLAADEQLGSPTHAPLAVIDEDGRTGAFLAPVGRRAENEVVHYDGETWSAEPVCAPRGAGDPPSPPAACPPFATNEEFEIVALSATGPDNAWMLAKADEGRGRGIVLYRRVVLDGERVWQQRELGDGGRAFAEREQAASGITAVAPLGGKSDPLTATNTGVWIDGSLESGGAERHFTLFFRAGEGTTSWCDVADVCTHPFGIRFSRNVGYQSIAFDGEAFGSRIITSPLEPGASGEATRGHYLRLEGSRFERMVGAGRGSLRTAAFRSPEDGWLQGPVHITRAPQGEHLEGWPVPLRRPLTDVTTAPGATPGSDAAQALAVGVNGSVARYVPGEGWSSEFLLTSSGSVAKSALRGVAWPEPGRAHAVGDGGAMWLWRAATGLWERDPGAPIGLDGQLMDVAFDPANPDRGYAVGRGGIVLAYDKSWGQDALPADVAGRDITQVAFAGSQAIAAAGSDVLVNDGSGWAVDQGARALLDSVPDDNRLLAVAGLPDGGAVVAGHNVVLERDAAGGAWRFSDQPLPDMTVIAAGAFRAGDRVRAVVSVVLKVPYPPFDQVEPTDPNTPQPPLRAIPLAGDGFVLRETDHGWRDEQQSAFGDTGLDKPLKSDPIFSFALDASGDGWAVGGWGGQVDDAARGSEAQLERSLVQTAGIYRYSRGAPASPPGAGGSAVPLEAGPVRFAVGGNAQCEQACADLEPHAIGPDRTLTTALTRAADLTGRGDGPRFFAYTGGRTKPPEPQTAAEASRYAELLGSVPSVPVFAAFAPGDDAGNFGAAFASFPAPFGCGPPPSGVSVAGIPGVPASCSAARTHYAFDSAGPSGTLRTIVIDNSAGSLAASDPHQNPQEPGGQRAWLEAVLDDAKAEGIPAIVLGSRDLNTRFRPSLEPASDGQEVGELLRDHGASAYFFRRPHENRSYPIPAGTSDTIPSFGSGTLGYRSPVESSQTEPLALFGDPGFLVVEVDVAQRDPATNRAPVRARLIPVAEDLAIEAVDGTVLRRSRPALFRGLARRPRGGDRWGGQASNSGGRSPAGSDPYTQLPTPCGSRGCANSLQPEFRFTSSDPDIGDFVQQDPSSTNLRKPLIGPDDKVISDSGSGLFCAFNAGTTTITVESGGLSYSRRVTVLGGSALRPCGTRPLAASRFTRRTITRQPSNSVPPPPPPPPSSPPVTPSIVPPPAPALAPRPKPVPQPRPLPQPQPFFPGALAQVKPVAPVRATPTPPPPVVAPPIPPGGALARVFQVEEKREEEAATEESHAFARYRADEHTRPEPYVLLIAALAALAGASIRGAARGHPRVEPAPVSSNHDRRHR